VKLDNGFAFSSAGPQPRTLTSVVLFLLKEKIVPVFTAPRKPWNQASVEGANSVFSRKFWVRFRFQTLSEVDDRLEEFNDAYESYLQYEKPHQPTRTKDTFTPRVHFIRKVYEHPESQRGYIDVVKEQIFLPKAYIGLFVLAEWNLKEDKLIVYFEKDNGPVTVKKQNFFLNRVTRQKV
jgi:lipopolysaccharide biosynthesis glycosyltransferase